ncbi:ATP-binding protein [Kovacikia minuta CCNUW1]|uniref:ATP-binding protein n=1 Tax=Kovacikia minuta TaxID=2931930 RepID=UPI001CCD29BE|nr:ATP-binding protein [Kovacikia minuta]UBF25453.1 ATP-binding protein [Kovacikia minuta CCNUW1]
MSVNPFNPQALVGRRAELNQVCHILASDGDLLLAGVPGSGRRTLLHRAAQTVGVRVIEIDCLRATDSTRFLKLLAEGITSVFNDPAELKLIQYWSKDQPVMLEQSAPTQVSLTWKLDPKGEWCLFQSLLSLPQILAEWLNCRVVLVFLNFPHVRSWDRSDKWQSYLRQEIQEQTRVSYALIATVAESWVQHSNMQVILLGPLKHEDLQPWIVECMAAQGLQFDPNSGALHLFLDYIQGHVGEAIALARRIWSDQLTLQGGEKAAGSGQWAEGKPGARSQEKARRRGDAENSLIQNSKFKIQNSPYPTPHSPLPTPHSLISAHQVHQSTLSLVEDLSLTFESLILLLPPSQVRVLESLALDPTDSPHSREYIQKHQLSRGGGLQGALASLQQKGLVYGSEYHYRITMPLFAFWLKHHLT